MAEESCAGCGLVIAGGTEACQAIFEQLSARDFGDPAYGRMHRMVVDAYCLQHPDRYCLSAKSLAAHLCGMCELIEHDGDRALPSAPLRRWLDGERALEKPSLPDVRGAVTIAGVAGEIGPDAYAGAVERWAESTWVAYSSLHAIAREWLSRALTEHRRLPRMR